MLKNLKIKYLYQYTGYLINKSYLMKQVLGSEQRQL